MSVERQGDQVGSADCKREGADQGQEGAGDQTGVNQELPPGRVHRAPLWHDEEVVDVAVVVVAAAVPGRTALGTFGCTSAPYALQRIRGEFHSPPTPPSLASEV